MMNCREVQDQLIEFFEDQLDQNDTEQIRAHLGMCPGCREELRAIGQIIGGLKSQRLPDPGEAFWRDFPIRVRKAFYQDERHTRVPILQKVWKGIYGSTNWLALPKPLTAAVSVGVVVLMIAGLLFFKAEWFWTGSRNTGEETPESYYGGIGTVVSSFTPGSLEGLSSYQLDDVSQGLMGWLNGLGNSMEEAVNGNGFIDSRDIFAQLEGLNSEELDFVYDALEKRYLESTTYLFTPMG